MQAFGKLDILVSNAAVNPAVGAIVDQPDEVIDKIFDVNVKAAIRLVQEAAPHLKAGSSIVFISSQAGLL